MQHFGWLAVDMGYEVSHDFAFIQYYWCVFAKNVAGRDMLHYDGREVRQMDERLKDIVNHLESMKIGLDEPFKFHCTMCGKCCINREGILLSPRDINCSHWIMSLYTR